ncbi:Protein of unknown function [Bowdeniella nasicola]|uniref:DUF2505 domain-containing protein n=1 Tax=Bowdeniella nasicola TaxID=208480 RepID=A0A1H4DIW6_9ACTO|nr:DUF2505 domain-containing protein [Bowdeniella nasicola]SEA72664.1 Protein of unknown function [Bowdeniella nasicola]
MHFSTSVTYPASAVKVAELWRDESFQRTKAERAGARRSSVTIAGDADLTVTIRAEIPSDVLPKAARRFVGAVLEVTIVEAWEPADGDGRRAGTLSLDIAGAPVRVNARMELLPVSATECTRTIDGDVKASVPLFSGPIERAAVGAVEDVVAAEKAIAVDYLKN